MPEIDLLLERAQLLLEQGRSRDAKDAIRQVLEAEPEHHYALSLLTRCYYDNKQFDEGIETIHRAISLDPLISYYFYLLGFGHYQKNENTAAIDNIDRAIRLDPYRAEYYGLLSFVLIEERKFAQALEKADEGLAIQPDNITCLNARARALNKLRQTEAAIETMQDALAQDPDNEMTHATIGWNLLEKGRHKEAEKHFLEALRINPNQLSSRLGLKESLKSNIPPYRWLLQYSFWISNKGRNFQVALPILLYVVFRLLIGLFDQHENTTGLSLIIASIYLLIVVTSWTINSIANFILFFHPVGKHAITRSERIQAVTVVSALVTGLSIIILAQFSSLLEGTSYYPQLFFAGLVALSLALPFSELEYPVQLKGNGWRGKATLVLAVLGLITLFTYLIAPSLSILFIIYAIVFMIYNWTGIGR